MRGETDRDPHRQTDGVIIVSVRSQENCKYRYRYSKDDRQFKYST